ncbi:hypothetical protein Pelo_14052 [Pelomyxa schiedti]|nr:hypothetical protein Pelo_14052 [Pelomyxa schiedti]
MKGVAAGKWCVVAIVIVVVVMMMSGLCCGNGVPDAYGYPNANERKFLVLLNNARADPETALADCAGPPDGPCKEKVNCYGPVRPLTFTKLNAHASRFHSQHMTTGGYFAHNSNCELVSNIETLYLGGTCANAAASCSCVGGTPTCGSGCTDPWERVALFEGSANAEDISSTEDPETSLDMFLTETAASTTCEWSYTNGHRYSLLKYGYGMGVGAAGKLTIDMSSGTDSDEDINLPSGMNLGSGTSAEFWANWYHPSLAPTVHKVNVDGTCYDMAVGLSQTANNTAYTHSMSLSTGCHNYYFVFSDGTTEHTYPSAGSLTTGTSCSDGYSSSSRPASCGGTTEESESTPTSTSASRSRSTSESHSTSTSRSLSTSTGTESSSTTHVSSNTYLYSSVGTLTHPLLLLVPLIVVAVALSVLI